MTPKATKGDTVETINGVGIVDEVRLRKDGYDYLIRTGQGYSDVYTADEFEILS